MMKRFDCHTHTHRSNLHYRDSTNFESGLIDRAIELGLSGIAITDHAVLSGHIEAIQHLKKLREDGIGVDFKLGLGTEIYLVDREVIKEAREKNEPTRFYHLVLIAKNYEGYRALAELSSNSWENSFYFRGMERTPTYKDYFSNWMMENRGNIVATSACLGSEFAKRVLDFAKEQSTSNRMEIDKFLKYMNGLLGEDFYIEIQPSNFEEQIIYNKLALQIAQAYGIKTVINTDAHYLSKEMKEIHSIYLKSQNAERETEAFYSSTYLMGYDELKSYFPYMSSVEFDMCIKNSIEIESKISEFDLFKKTEVPKTTIKFDSNKQSIFSNIDIFNALEYQYIEKFRNSDNIVDRVLLQQIEYGLENKDIKVDEKILSRLEVELEALWKVSEGLQQRMASYYLLTKEIVEIMWKVSLVGVSRGSAGSFYICYLLGITQINPINYELDYWRHIDKNKIELADIDIDTEKGQRGRILELVKEKYGYKNVLNIATFKTEGTSSAIQTMCRGMGISTEDAQYISSLAVEGLTVKKCLDLFDKDKDATTLIKEMMCYDGLIENVIAIEGLVCGRSVHASGVYIYQTEYWNSNAMMRAPNGQPITQYDMKCSDYQGGLKLDFLTIEALDRIRKDMELLIEDNIIEWKGTLKETYDTYLHPDILNMDDEEMWNNLCDGKILDAFQMDSPVGKSSIAKVQPRSFSQICDTNALMRISCDGKQPIDRYNDNKSNISNWYKEMKEVGLEQKEIITMEKHLLKNYGVASTQEQAMKLSMDENIAGFDLIWANKLRKAIAKAYAKDTLELVYNRFLENGTKLGNRREFLEYVWESNIVPMYNYSFSEPHIFGYSLILMQELNLYKISPLHWKVACLCVNAGDINEDVSRATDYGALAKAIGGMEKGFIQPPSINKSSLGFKPNIETQTALYGLGAINGISTELANDIIKLRPFNSFNDFINKLVKTKIVKPSKMYNLIKAGCFNEFEKDRVKVMLDFINYVVPNKTSLTTANIPKLIEYGAIPVEFSESIMLYNFKKYVFNKTNLYKEINKTHGYYRIPQDAMEYYENNLLFDFSDTVLFDDDGNTTLSSKEFSKVYKIKNSDFEAWLKSQNALDIMNYCSKNEVWCKYCSGSLAKWDMDSISYYTDKHELDEMELSRFYTVSIFNNLPRIPDVSTYKNPKNGREYKRNKLSIIAGTVVEKNKIKSMITINTQYGVVDVKFNRVDFSKFDRKTPEEPSWLSRGTKLIIVGFRRGEGFIPRVYQESVFASSVMKIEQLQNGRIEIKNERIFEDSEV